MNQREDNIEQQINNVALYIRKSRGDEEKDLINHKIKLTEIAETYNWQFEIYKEIGSGGSIADRVVIQKMLEDVENNLFDAILVIDFDRLVRSSGADQERLLHTLRVSNTLVVTASPYNILNVNNETDLEIINFKSFFGKMELSTITKRLKLGRAMGVQRGNWVFGRAPFGYDYDRKTKKLVINEDEAAVVRRVTSEFVDEGKSTGDIAHSLNRDGILSSTGSSWSYGMIAKLLRRDVYQGNITYNRSTGNNQTKNKYHANPYKELPKSEWKTVYNTHEALITESQRELIEKSFSSRNKRKAKTNSDGSAFDLSGLVWHSSGFKYTRKFEKNNRETMVLSIDHLRADKNDIPKYQSIEPDLIRHTIYESVGAMEKELAEKLEEKDNKQELDYYMKKLKQLSNQHNKILESYERIIDGYTGGLYDMDKAKELKLEKEAEQGEVEYQLREVRHKIDAFSNAKNIDRMDRIKQFKKDIKDGKSNVDLNLLYKSVINKIVVDKEGKDKVKIKINFL